MACFSIPVCRMHTLFDILPLLPEGFTYYPDFISQAAETSLIAEISHLDLHTFTFQGYEAKRRVASFGKDWNFETQRLSEGRAIPQTFMPLVTQVARHLSLPKEQIAELLVTEYPPGAVINWHRDAPPFDLIAGISLGSDCTVRLRPHDKTHQNRKSMVSFPVRRRSLYVMQGISRTHYQHSITAVPELRYSITLRTLK